MKKNNIVFLLGCLPLFAACVGIKADINLQPNGRGSLVLEYRIDKSLADLGTLDGNAMYPVLPVGKADFQNTVKRIEGLQLRSFSSKTEKTGQVVYTVRLSFTNIKVLLNCLGKRALYETKDKGSKLVLVLWEQWDGIDGDLVALTQEVSKGYEFSLRFGVKGGARLRVLDNAGQTLDIGVLNGERFTIKLEDLVSQKNGVRLEILW